MHRSTHAALALVLLAAQPVQAQAPLPPGFVDAAAVVDGMIVELFRRQQFRGRKNRRLRASALPIVGTGGERAGRG